MLEGKKIKTILHLIPTLEGGGAEKQLVMLCNELANRGYYVHIGLRRGGVNLEKLSNKVQVHYLGDYKIIDPRLFFNILKLINKINPDIIQTWLAQMDIVGGLCAIFKKVPWIMTERVSELWYKKYPITSSIRLFIAKYSVYIIANSKKGISYYHKKLPNFKYLKVINNAIDISLVQNANINFQAEGNILLSVGRLTEQKNYKIIIEAVYIASKKQDFKYYIFGDGDLKEEINNLIKEKNLEKVVMLLSYNPKWWGLLNKAKCLISMSHYEGSPNVVLEAMAGKCPLIVSDIQEHRELLDDKSALFILNNDAKSLALAIKSTLDNFHDAKLRAENGHIIVSKFTISKTTNDYEEVYKLILKRGK